MKNKELIKKLSEVTTECLYNINGRKCEDCVLSVFINEDKNNYYNYDLCDAIRDNAIKIARKERTELIEG